jgi:hypothetical protein
VGLVELFELAVVGSEIFAGHNLVQDDLLEFVVFNFDPEVVFTLLIEILEKLVDLLELLPLELNHVILPVLVALQDQLDQPLALSPKAELGLFVEFSEDAPNPLELLLICLLTLDHALHIQKEGNLYVVGSGILD